MKAVKIWLLIILSWLIKFGAPLGVAYWKFAVYQEGIGGSFFFFIVSIIAIAFYVKMRKIVKKMDTNKTKTVVKGLVGVFTATMLYFVVNYIGENFNELTWVMLTLIGANILAVVPEFIAVGIDKEYCDGIGVI